MKLLYLGKGHDFIELLADFGAGHAQDGPVQDRYSPGRSTRDESRCPPPAGGHPAFNLKIRPVVGSVMRLSSLSSVDLPAPFRPMMPTTSPILISKETFLSAQNSSRVPLACTIVLSEAGVMT